MGEPDTTKSGGVIQYDYSSSFEQDILDKLEALDGKLDEIIEHLLELNLDRNDGYGIER